MAVGGKNHIPKRNFCQLSLIYPASRKVICPGYVVKQTPVFESAVISVPDQTQLTA